MKTLEYKVMFTTPAFLGNAEQSGQWRTPPFKALLRQWWRVAEVRGGKPDVGKLHSREGTLFGRAADEGTTASQVRLRVDWREKKDSLISAARWKVDTGEKVRHDEAEKAGFKVDAALYLGYGPLDADKSKGHYLKRESAVAPGARPRVLKLEVPPSEEQRFRDVVRLAHAFGALGSRCRNGWGSLHFDEGGLTPGELSSMLDPANRAGRDWLRGFSRDWKQALQADWCHALGRDETGLLLWRTEAMAKWEDVLKTLAEVKIAFRTQFHFNGRGPHSVLCDRQILAYPVTTNHALVAWGRKARSANQILFKVLPDGKKFVGLVAHLPHGLPKPLQEGLSDADRTGLNAREQKVWAGVHAVLNQNLTRLP
jgi:CRISPR-associated protein Cmr1